MQTRKDAVDNRWDVVIIGGPKVSRNVPPWCSVSQESCTLQGLKAISEKVADADLLVYWPDWRLLGQYPLPKDLLHSDVTMTEEGWLLNGKKPKRHSVGKKFVCSALFAGVNNLKERNRVFSWVLDTLSGVMEKSLTVAESGHVVILVVPSDFPEWKDRGAGWNGKWVPWVGHAAESYRWFSNRLTINEAVGNRVQEGKVLLPSKGSRFFESVRATITKIVDNWPVSLQLDLSCCTDSERGKNAVEGELPAEHVIPFADDRVHCYPIVQGRAGDVRCFAFVLGSKGGGYVVMPEPRSLKAILECLPPPFETEKTSLYSEPDQRNASIPIDNHDVFRKAAPFRMLSSSAEECRTARDKIEEILKSINAQNPLVGDSPAMMQLYPQILKAVNYQEYHILVYGETGTGKKMLYELLQRLCEVPGKPFIRPSLLGLDDTHLLSAVFGHVRGAYTDAVRSRIGAVEEAKEGTVILDDLQAENRNFFNAFLHVLEPGAEYTPLGGNPQRAKCRFIAGFNRPIEQMRDGALPDDWPARFMIHIEMPRLEMRREDIPVLARRFFGKFLENHSDLAMSEADSEQLWEKCLPKVDEWKNAPWSGGCGNVRGLENAVVQHLMHIIPVSQSRKCPDPCAKELEAKPHKLKTAGNPRRISSEDLGGLLAVAAGQGLPWSKLSATIVTTCGGKPLYSSLKALKNRVRNDHSPAISKEVRKYVDGLEDAACAGK